MCKYSLVFAISFFAFSCLPMQAQDLQTNNSNHLMDSSSNSSSNPKINELKEPDYSYFINDLKKKIKANWYPPTCTENKRVVLSFNVNKNGSLDSKIIVKQSSGNQEFDDVAILAVSSSSPFNPLPQEQINSTKEVELTVDYDVVVPYQEYDVKGDSKSIVYVLLAHSLKEPNYGPFMRALKKRIKKRWNPPKGEESKHVVLIFTVNRDGSLNSKQIKIKKSSGNDDFDNSCKKAIFDSTPFQPLPLEHKYSRQQIEFTFAYNVIGAKKQHQ